MELVKKKIGDVKTSRSTPASVKSTSKPRRKRAVLDEDSYVEKLDEIIQRDFFPDLEKMTAQKEYIEASERKDRVKMRELLIKYGPKARLIRTPSQARATPATFETPSIAGDKFSDAAKTDMSNITVDTDLRSNIDTREGGDGILKSGGPSNTTLDKFLSTHMSEDNESFEQLMEEAERKKQLKHSWLFEQEQEHEDRYAKQLALPSCEVQALTDTNSSSGGVDNWTYKAINAVMYVPDGMELSTKEKMEVARKKEREIIYSNTRFIAQPFNERANSAAVHQAAASQSHALANQGRVGADGKELAPTETPKVGGFSFVATPSPAPGIIDASPLMTWGEIEGTPFRLDGGDTPLPSTHGPQFKIPHVPVRDSLAHSLDKKASAQHRKKKEAALKKASATFYSPSPGFGSPRSSDRLRNMSPAAQRLASSKLGVRVSTDKALRESYTPSPSRTPHHQRTPTPYSSSRSSSSTSSLRAMSEGARTPTLTDDLLRLPTTAASTSKSEKKLRQL